MKKTTKKPSISRFLCAVMDIFSNFAPHYSNKNEKKK